mmetsp:Transcript_50300/g.112992  ORF Transcript_50300/g.112992 Transcript_50300/m.112992 type:complete len:570 (-) Transcript_50300:132-1841(-)
MEEAGMVASRVREYQRNSAFAAFMLVVCTAAFVYLTNRLQAVMLPLAWSAFWAMPLTALVRHINDIAIWVCSCVARLFRRKQPEVVETLKFRAVVGDTSLLVDRCPKAADFLMRVNDPLRCSFPLTKKCCRRRVRITHLCPLSSSSLGVAEDEAEEADVNRLMLNWAYYVRSPADLGAADGAAEAGDDSRYESAPLQLELSLDPEGRCPAVVDGLRTGEKKELKGTLEVDKTTTFTWTFAVLAVLTVSGLGIWLAVTFVILGVQAFKEQSTLNAYLKGIQEFTESLEEVGKLLEGVVDIERFKEYLINALQDVASSGITRVQNIILDVVVFFIYLTFWICEPLPISRPVAKVFKSYLLLKTFVCFLFASLMSIVLAALGCKIWHLFFVITFLLNYLPEVGPLLTCVLMLPAVLLDGSVVKRQREINAMVLLVLFFVFKLITGNVIEVKMYATRGGEFMRMHPVVMMALIFLFEALFGFSGMFLAIPVMAAVKYFLVSTNTPAKFLHPLLKLIEGDEAAAHRMFVYCQRSEAALQEGLSLGRSKSSVRPSSGRTTLVPRAQDPELAETAV